MSAPYTPTLSLVRGCDLGDIEWMLWCTTHGDGRGNVWCCQNFKNYELKI